jgi:PncC family amidohydrolase
MFNKKDIQQLADQLLNARQTIAVAESVTAGLLQNAMAAAERASEFFEGGITAYNINQKYAHLHINLEHAIACNCVSEQVAAEMATGVAKTFKSDWGIGITGYASPIPGHDMKELFACFAIANHDNIILAKTITCPVKEPLKVQLEYVNQVINEMISVLKNQLK